MKTLLLILLISLCASCGTQRNFTNTKASINTETTIKEVIQLVPVVNPADSAALLAMLECDENGKVLLRALQMLTSDNTSLIATLDSLGNLTAKFNVPRDTVWLPSKTLEKTVLKEKEVEVERIVERIVEKKLNLYQRLCMWFAPISFMSLLVFVFFKFKIYKLWQ